MENWQKTLFEVVRAAGLNAGPHPGNGSLSILCTRCRKATLDLPGPGIAKCPACGASASGNPYQIAQALRAMESASRPDGLWTLSALMEHEPNPADQIWHGGVLAAGAPTAIVGAPGVGKSRLSLQAAVDTILGRKFLNWETNGQGKRWLFLQTENSADRLKHDLERMTAVLNRRQWAEVDAHLRILRIEALDVGSICMEAGHDDRSRIEALLGTWSPDVVVIDPLRDAGRGDPNKDDVMTDACRGISEVTRHGGVRRTPLVIHHGRTGAAEASKVFGDDAASFARNSKVLYGWLRSQINVAAAGIDHPGVVIIGCAKVSNGPAWPPFAARLNERHMRYEILPDFDLDEWAEGMGTGSGRRKKTVTPDDVATVVVRAGGEIVGGVNAPHGLVQEVMKEFKIGRPASEDAVRVALGDTIQYIDRPRGTGGKPMRVYVLKKP
jgi:hypothetical protein